MCPGAINRHRPKLWSVFAVRRLVAGRVGYCTHYKSLGLRSLAALLVAAFVPPSIAAQENPQIPSSRVANGVIMEMIQGQQQSPGAPARRSLTISDAVSVFLQQNLQLVA